MRQVLGDDVAGQRRHQLVAGVLDVQSLDVTKLAPDVVAEVAAARQPRAAHLSTGVLDHVDNDRRVSAGDNAQRRRLAPVHRRFTQMKNKNKFSHGQQGPFAWELIPLRYFEPARVVRPN